MEMENEISKFNNCINQYYYNWLELKESITLNTSSCYKL